MMTVSLIIPIYNVSNYIERCLNSAFGQSYPHIEYILIDDASTDDSIIKAKRLIENCVRNDKIVLVTHKHNLGLSEARNTGVHNSTGEYLFFLDSDDELPKDAISKLVECCLNQKDRKIDVVMGGLMKTGVKKEIESPTKLSLEVLSDINLIRSTFFKKQWPEIACNKLIHRTVFKNKSLYFEKDLLHEDTLWSFKLAVNIECIALIKDVTYIYHIHSGSISQSKGIRNFDCIQKILDYIVDYSIRNSLYKEYPTINTYLIDLYYFFFKEINKSSLSKTEKANFLGNIKQSLKKLERVNVNFGLVSQIKRILIKMYLLIVKA